MKNPNINDRLNSLAVRTGAVETQYKHLTRAMQTGFNITSDVAKGFAQLLKRVERIEKHLGLSNEEPESGEQEETV
ncbi:MAG: hypothetical protein KDH96_02005, partial [Candidatus Riesia sp.]|nr:hypothetical protein [Candidatus Riesia sp.]